MTGKCCQGAAANDFFFYDDNFRLLTLNQRAAKPDGRSCPFNKKQEKEVFSNPWPYMRSFRISKVMVECTDVMNVDLLLEFLLSMESEKS